MGALLGGLSADEPEIGEEKQGCFKVVVSEVNRWVC